MITPNSETVIPNMQLVSSNDDAELQIKLGAIDLRITLTMREFMSLMQGRVVYPKARFRPITGNVQGFQQRDSTITLDADTLAMPTLDEDGHYLTAAKRNEHSQP